MSDLFPAERSAAELDAASGEGLARWMSEVVALHERARRALRVDVVHDLRVAIRRCRSMVQGLREIDDDAGAARWKALSDTGRPLFQGLGDLRDAQVLRELADELLRSDPAHPHIVDMIDKRVEATKRGARAAVETFDPAAWQSAAEGLSVRAKSLLRERPLFDHLALRRFFEARELHRAAMRSKSSTALHQLLPCFIRLIVLSISL
jgi:CHAD domain-containing protein